MSRQDEDLDTLGEQRGLVFVADYVDNDLSASAKSRRPRPEYQRMLRDARNGQFEVIASYTTGRITRRPREFEDLIDLSVEHGIEFEYVRSPSFDLRTAQGRRIARTLAAQDAGEAEELGERVARAAQQRAQQGLNHGGRRCFGYTTDGLHLEPAEAAEVARMADQLLSGVPLGSITRDLNDRGVRTVRGNKWAPGTVRSLLLAPRLAGLSEYRGAIVGKGQWPGIISEEIHQAVVALMSDPARRTTTGNRAAYLLSGLAKCAVCGNNVSSYVMKSSGRTPRYFYRCRTGACVACRRDWADDYVTEVILARLERDDARDLLVDQSRPDFDALRTEAQSIRIRLDELAADFADGTIDRMQLRAGTEKGRSRLDEIERIQRHTSRGPILRDLVDAPDPRAVWQELSLDRRRAVVECLIAIRLHKGGSGRHGFDPAKIEITPKD